MPRVTSTDGVEIFYTTAGEGEPLVLSHGPTHTWQSWQDLGYVDALKDRYRLVLIDARGHGESGQPHDPSAYAMPHHLADVLAVLAELDIERCHFLGYSLGATVGYALAARHPERLLSLIAYGAQPYRNSPALQAMIDEDVRLLRRGMEAWIAMLESIGVFDQYPDPAGRRARLLAADTEALSAMLVALRDYGGVGEALARMTMPCLIVCGERESARHQDQARQAAAEMPQATCVSAPGIGHAMVHADVIMPYVASFLERLHA